MKILSLDTAMAACSAAVVDTASAVPLAAGFEAMERGHAEALPPMVAAAVRASGLGMNEISRIMVTVGPGTFTGVRIGLAFARGLGLARGIPVIGIDTLSAIAANEPLSGPMLVVSDARNNEVYAARYDADHRCLGGPELSTLDQLCEGIAPGTRIIGTAAGALIRHSGRTDLVRSSAGDLPVAAHFARCAAGAEPGAMPSPLYLRAPDAKPQNAPLRRASSLAIEQAGLSGAPLLAAMHAEAFDEGWTAAAFADLLRTPGAAALIGIEAGEPAAFLLTRRAADEAEIITLGTRPQAQRRGVARQLLARHMAELAAAGISTLFLEVAAGNVAARALYEGLGFAEAGRRKAYYQRGDGSREDAVVMRRDLRP